MIYICVICSNVFQPTRGGLCYLIKKCGKLCFHLRHTLIRHTVPFVMTYKQTGDIQHVLVHGWTSIIDIDRRLN